MYSWSNLWFRWSVLSLGRADRCLHAGRLRLAAVGARRLLGQGPVGEHLPCGGRARDVVHDGLPAAKRAPQADRMSCSSGHGARRQRRSRRPRRDARAELHDVPRRAGHERVETRRTWPASIPRSSSSSCRTTRPASARAPSWRRSRRTSPTATSRTWRLTTPIAEGAHGADDVRRIACRRWCESAPAAQHRALHLVPRRRRPEARRAVA